MRVADIFKRLLGIDAVRISQVDVADQPSGRVITVTVERRRNRRMHCSRCGQRARTVYDRQVRFWRHLDAFRVRCVLKSRGAPGHLLRVRGHGRGGALGPARIPADARVRGHVCVARALRSQECCRRLDAHRLAHRRTHDQSALSPSTARSASVSMRSPTAKDTAT